MPGPQIPDRFETPDIKQPLYYTPPEGAFHVQQSTATTEETSAALSQRHYRQGLEYFYAGNEEMALEQWKKAIEIDPSNQDARTGYERLLRHKGQ